MRDKTRTKLTVDTGSVCSLKKAGETQGTGCNGKWICFSLFSLES